MSPISVLTGQFWRHGFYGSGQVRSGQVGSGLVRLGQFGLGRVRSGQAGSGWIGWGQFGSEERRSPVEIKGKMKTSKEETMRNEQEEETRSGKKVKRNTD